MADWQEYKAASKQRGSLAMEVFLVESTPGADLELVKQTLPDHLAYQAQQEQAGKLMFAGPLSDETGEQMNAAGMIIYRANSFDEARKLAEQDPMHSCGARSFTLRSWLINEGSLQLDIKFSAQKVGFLDV